MPNPYFNFKQFTINQANTAMKVGTDGVLLGAWANCTHATRILDIGTGTGLIALMLAQRSEAAIDAIELDENAAIDAVENFTSCPWSSRLTFYRTAIQEFASNSHTKYDLIVCNPPFFSDSLKTTDQSRNKARHNDTLPAKDLFLSVSKLMAVEGSFALIIPALNQTEFILQAASFQLFPNYITWVKPTPQSEPKRMLINFKYNYSLPVTTDQLIVEENGRHQYSRRFIELTRDFYLNM